MFGNGKHLSKIEIDELDIVDQSDINLIIDYARNFIDNIPDEPTVEEGFVYDVAHPAFKEGERYEGFIGMGTTYFQKYGGNLLIEVNVTHLPSKEIKTKMVNGYLNFKIGDKKVSQKLEVLDDGDLVVNVTGDPEVDEFIIPSEDFIDNPDYVPGEKPVDDYSLQWGALCVNTCCRFRKYGNPLGKLVEYEHCGSNCGPFGDKGGGSPVNALDECCAAHDSCWKEFGKWDCECDSILISCARNTSNAGSSRVANFFQATYEINC